MPCDFLITDWLSDQSPDTNLYFLSIQKYFVWCPHTYCFFIIFILWFIIQPGASFYTARRLLMWIFQNISLILCVSSRYSIAISESPAWYWKFPTKKNPITLHATRELYPGPHAQHYILQLLDQEGSRSLPDKRVLILWFTPLWLSLLLQVIYWTVDS